MNLTLKSLCLAGCVGVAGVLGWIGYDYFSLVAMPSDLSMEEEFRARRHDWVKVIEEWAAVPALKTNGQSAESNRDRERLLGQEVARNRFSKVEALNRYILLRVYSRHGYSKGYAFVRPEYSQNDVVLPLAESLNGGDLGRQGLLHETIAYKHLDGHWYIYVIIN